MQFKKLFYCRIILPGKVKILDKWEWLGAGKFPHLSEISTFPSKIIRKCNSSSSCISEIVPFSQDSDLFDSHLGGFDCSAKSFTNLSDHLEFTIAMNP